MSEVTEQRYKIGKRFFKHAPAFKGRKNKTTGEYLSKRLNRIAIPFRGAEPWQCNVYYFWWEFLRRHEGYKDCCERGGKGKYRKLYADFGNIHEHDDFWKWWRVKITSEGYGLDENGKKRLPNRGEYLFAEPPARFITKADRVSNTRSDTLTVNIPLEVRTPQLVQQLRKLLNQYQERVRDARSVSRALYPVAIASPKLIALHKSLRVYDIEQEHKRRLPNHEKADLAELDYNNKNDNQHTVSQVKKFVAEGGTLYTERDVKELEDTIKQRKRIAYKNYLNAAEDYIHFAGLGEFPKRRDSKSKNKTRNEPKPVSSSEDLHREYRSFALANMDAFNEYRRERKRRKREIREQRKEKRERMKQRERKNG